MLLTSILLALSLRSFVVAHNQHVSPNGKCGGSEDYTCLNSDYGNCCSQYSWCGSTAAYCKVGCQSDFGICESISSSSILGTTLSTSTRLTTSARFSSQKSSTQSTSARSSGTPSAQPPSTNARCGPQYGGQTCQDSRWGDCCSIYSYCGSTRNYCAPGNCQLGYGLCDPASSSSSSARTSTSTQRSSSSRASSSTQRSSSSSTRTSLSTQRSSSSSRASSSTRASSSSSRTSFTSTRTSSTRTSFYLSSTISSSVSSSKITSSSISSIATPSTSVTSTSVSSSATSSRASSSSVDSSSSRVSSTTVISSTPSSTPSLGSTTASVVASTSTFTTPTPSSSCVRQLLVNGDFQSNDFPPWFTYNANSASQPSFLIVNDAPFGSVFRYSSTMGDDSHLRQSVTNLPVGSTIACSFKYRTTGELVGLDVWLELAGVRCAEATSTSVNYQTKVGTAVTTTNDLTAYLWLQYGTTSRIEIFVDDITICVLSPASGTLVSSSSSAQLSSSATTSSFTSSASSVQPSTSSATSSPLPSSSSASSTIASSTMIPSVSSSSTISSSSSSPSSTPATCTTAQINALSNPQFQITDASRRPTGWISISTPGALNYGVSSGQGHNDNSFYSVVAYDNSNEDLIVDRVTVTLQQNIVIPSGSSVSCSGWGRTQGGNVQIRKWNMYVDGVLCATYQSSNALTWQPFSSNSITVSGQTHVVLVVMYTETPDATELSMYTDDLAVTYSVTTCA